MESAAARIPFFILLVVVALQLLVGTSANSPVLPNLNSPMFTYSGATGPNKWASLSPYFSACNGKKQSPVDIRKKNVFYNNNLEPLIRHYGAANATLFNNGFNLGVHFDKVLGTLVVDGKNYTLKQMHWHSPSEHRLNGVQYSTELHLVHQADDQSLSVVAILFQLGKDDVLLKKIKEEVVELSREASGSTEDAHIPLGTIEIKYLQKRTHKYYRYIGSLTVPPCTENVIWNVLGKVRSISKEQIKAIKAPLGAAYKNNSRPLQPLNGRKIELYDESRKQ